MGKTVWLRVKSPTLHIACVTPSEFCLGDHVNLDKHDHQNQTCPLCNTPQLDPTESNCAICGFDFSTLKLEADQNDALTKTNEQQNIDFLLDEIHLINVLCAL
jgi:hypothetical protein